MTLRPPGGAALATAALASGLLAAAALPPLGLSSAAWIAWIPWMAALVRGPSPRAGAWSGALHAVTWNAVSCWWLALVIRRDGDLPVPLAVLSFVAALVILAPYGALVGWATAVLVRRHGPPGLAGLVLAWPAVDALRSRLSLGFPWAVPGMTQADGVALGLAEVLGVHGVTAAVLAGNAAVALALLPRTAGGRRTAVALGAFAAAGVAGALALQAGRAREECRAVAVDVDVTRLAGEGGERGPGAAIARAARAAGWTERGSPGRMRIALVQGALPEDVALAPDPAVERMRAELQFGLTQEALEAGADLVAWSESAYPETVGREPWMALDLRRLLASHAGAEALVGALVEVPGAGRGPALTNSALLVDADGLRGRYDKVWLVPFGEYVPAARLFFWFDRLVDVVGDLKPGRSSEPLPSSRARLGAHVCYEAVLAQHVADLVRAGATLLVNVTNDGWFRGSAAPEQHLRFSVLRAVELRRTVVRCAHSGISAVVAPSGRVIARLGEGRRGVVLATVVPSKESTAYARWGDVPVAAGGIVAGLAVAFALGSRRLGARAGEVRP